MWELLALANDPDERNRTFSYEDLLPVYLALNGPYTPPPQLPYSDTIENDSDLDQLAIRTFYQDNVEGNGVFFDQANATEYGMHALLQFFDRVEALVSAYRCSDERRIGVFESMNFGRSELGYSPWEPGAEITYLGDKGGHGQMIWPVDPPDGKYQRWRWDAKMIMSLPCAEYEVVRTAIACTFPGLQLDRGHYPEWSVVRGPDKTIKGVIGYAGRSPVYDAFLAAYELSSEYPEWDHQFEALFLRYRHALYVGVYPNGNFNELSSHASYFSHPASVNELSRCCGHTMQYADCSTCYDLECQCSACVEFDFHDRMNGMLEKG
jgi:hypothetical protein